MYLHLLYINIVIVRETNVLPIGEGESEDVSYFFVRA